MDGTQDRQGAFFILSPGRAGSSEQAVSPMLTRRNLPTGEVVEEAYGLVYYGGVVDPEAAKAIDLGPGATFAAADIPLAVGKAPAFHIRGVVINGVTGQPAAGVTVRAVPNQRSFYVQTPNGTADRNGAFDLAGAVPGSYSLFSVMTIPAAGPGQTATPIGTYSLIQIGSADTENLKLILVPRESVPGRVVIGGRPPSDNDPDLAKIRVTLTRDPDVVGNLAVGANPGGVVAANGTFTLAMMNGVNAGRIRTPHELLRESDSNGTLGYPGGWNRNDRPTFEPARNHHRHRLWLH
jgi:hypothetical protein